MAACHRAQTPCAAPRSRASAAQSVSAPRLSSSARSDAGPAKGARGKPAPAHPRTLRVTLRIAPEGGRRTLFATVPGHGRIPLGIVPAPFACAVSRRYGPGANPLDVPGNWHEVWEVGCKPGTPTWFIAASQGQLFVDRVREPSFAEVKLPIGKDTHVEVDDNVQVAPRTCAPDAPPVPVFTRLEHYMAPDPGYKPRRTARFRIPALGVVTDVFEIEPPMVCSTERSRNHLEFSCSSVEHSYRFEVRVQGGVLSMRTEYSGYGEDYLDVLGAVQLPCGARVHWGWLQIDDPKWSGFGGVNACTAHCDQRADVCRDACKTQRPKLFDDDGNPLGRAGKACLGRCKHLRCPCPLKP